MVNFIQGTEEIKLEVDGQYVPRIYFLDSRGNILTQVINQEGNPDYKYFYYQESAVIKSMKEALDIAPPQSWSSLREELWVQETPL